MGIKTIAEFVESREIADMLTSLNIDYLQGFSVGRPRDASEWLADYRSERDAPAPDC